MNPPAALGEQEAAKVAAAFTALAQKLSQGFASAARDLVPVVRYVQGNEEQVRFLCNLASRLGIHPMSIVQVLEAFGATPTGFKWGPFEVTRVCSDARLSTICATTARTRVYLHATPKGKVTPEFTKNLPDKA